MRRLGRSWLESPAPGALVDPGIGAEGACQGTVVQTFVSCSLKVAFLSHQMDQGQTPSQYQNYLCVPPVIAHSGCKTRHKQCSQHNLKRFSPILRRLLLLLVHFRFEAQHADTRCFVFFCSDINQKIQTHLATAKYKDAQMWRISADTTRVDKNVWDGRTTCTIHQNFCRSSVYLVTSREAE